ncbi:MAG TPA: SH3 domain-containing protein [Caldilineaceae bacterium]|nr:SH3 domain-containing protein [Caldilineaceae bacterium]
MKPMLALRLPLSMLLFLALGACAPLVAPNTTIPAMTPTPTSEAASNDTALENSATATVTTRSLRVRNEPLESAEVIAGIKENEQYRVLAISSDGLWVQLAIDGAPGGNGWVSASFVSITGPITDAATVEVPAGSLAITATGALSTTATTTATLAASATPAPGYALVRTDGTRLRVRSSPNVDSEIVGYVYDGESYPVVEISGDGQWVRIGGATDTVSDNPNGGWVAAEFVVVGQ